jgi:hypothetical protein
MQLQIDKGVKWCVLVLNAVVYYYYYGKDWNKDKINHKLKEHQNA